MSIRLERLRQAQRARDVAETERDQAQAEVARLREALEWYADETEHDDCCNDYGKRARAALEPEHRAHQNQEGDPAP